jgi:hypothetical protein
MRYQQQSLWLIALALTLLLATACTSAKPIPLESLLTPTVPILPSATLAAREQPVAVPTSPFPSDTPALLATTPPAPAAPITATPIPVLLASPTPIRSHLPTPTSTPSLVLANHETWKSDDWSLTVSNFTYETFSTPHFTLQNTTGRTVLLPPFSAKNFTITADSGEIFAPCSTKGSGWYNTWWQTYGETTLQPGETLAWDWTFSPYDPEHRACDTYSHSKAPIPAHAHTLTLTIERIGTIIPQVHWQTTIPRP